MTTYTLMDTFNGRAIGRVAGGSPTTTEVVHPDGFVVEQYARDE